MFENITAAPADPILGLADLFRADERPGKINLGIGVYKDETGKTPVLTSVKKAEQYLLENETTKNYLGIDGIPEFGRCTQELLFGKGSALINDKRARTAQTPGGTGALRVAADFLAKNTSVKRVWVSNPSWPNHKSVFNSAGLEVREYAYYDAENHTLDFDALINSLNEAQAGDVVLFHGCCHNPTGIDPTLEQWQTLAQLSVEKGWLPLFDFAYQGFARGLEECQPLTPDRWLNEGDTISIGNVTLQVLHCPGHTPGHVVFFDDRAKLLISGDVIFKGGVGRSDFPRGDHNQLISSIKDKLLPLGDDVIFIPGHGPLSTLGYERLHNPFLQDEMPVW